MGGIASRPTDRDKIQTHLLAGGDDVVQNNMCIGYVCDGTAFYSKLMFGDEKYSACMQSGKMKMRVKPAVGPMTTALCFLDDGLYGDHSVPMWSNTRSTFVQASANC
jgi:hypothetical protein